MEAKLPVMIGCSKYLWNEIKESKELEPITDDEKRVLLNRLANYQSDPDSAIDWQILRNEYI